MTQLVTQFPKERMSQIRHLVPHGGSGGPLAPIVTFVAIHNTLNRLGYKTANGRAGGFSSEERATRFSNNELCAHGSEGGPARSIPTREVVFMHSATPSALNVLATLAVASKYVF